MKSLKKINAEKIAIFRALQLGDMLCVIPAIRALKKAMPASKITLIGLPWAKAFVERFSNYFSDFLPFPGYPGLPEQGFHPDSFIQFMKRVAREKFDLLIQMQGNGSIVNPIIDLLKIPHVAGYYQKEEYCPNKKLFMPYPEGISEIEKHLSLINYLGIKSTSKSLEFPLTPEEENSYKLIVNRKINRRKYVVLHPGSRDLSKCWPAKNFAHVADLISEKGFDVILTGVNRQPNLDKR